MSEQDERGAATTSEQLNWKPNPTVMVSRAEQIMREMGLENVCSTAYAVQKRAMPNHAAQVIELPTVASYQLRVMSNLLRVDELPYREAVDFVNGNDAMFAMRVRLNVRAMIEAHHAYLSKWLEEHQEGERLDPLEVHFPNVIVKAGTHCEPLELKLSLAAMLRSNITKTDGKWDVDVRGFNTREADIVAAAEGRKR